MAPMRALRFAPGLACLLACGSLVLAGCGGGSSISSHVNQSAESGKSRPAPPKSAFPATDGRSLEKFLEEAKVLPTVKINASAEAFYPGTERYPFLVSEKAVAGKEGKEIADAEVAIYYVEVPKVKPGPQAIGERPVVGPFPASIESLATKPEFQSKTTTEDPDVASVVYSAQIPFPSEGEYKIVALIKEKGGLAEKPLASVHVGEFEKIPTPGEKAPLIQTPTAKSVGGDLAKISTRVPPDTQNKVNYADVLGKEPILLLFTTPKFCQSRACGPVVDVAEQAQHEFEGKANFIHMEIYNDNDPSKGVRPQVRRFHLPTEPWLFAINREGVISATIEGAFGTNLMRKTVDRVISE
ncbi:MAG: hypothetical protein JWO14_1148 [Solirubrobacterales bacterium]|nr:hypothetical protein [Solirubrobacterales bacterium]